MRDVAHVNIAILNRIRFNRAALICTVFYCFGLACCCLLQIEQEKLASLKKIDDEKKEKENKENRERESPRR